MQDFLPSPPRRLRRAILPVLPALVCFLPFFVLQLERTRAQAPWDPFRSLAIVALATLSTALLSLVWSTNMDVTERFPRIRRAWRLRALALLLAYGALLRVAGVWDYAFSPDEAIFAYTSSEPDLVSVWRASLANVHPPANFFLLHFLEQISWNFIWLKMPSILSGIAAIVLMYLFARELLGELTALLAAAAVAASPNLIELSRVARNYSPGMVFLLGALWLLARFLKRGEWRDYRGFAALAFFAAWWHYAFIEVFLGISVALALFGILHRWRWQEWAEAFALQLPLAFFYLLSFRYHVPKMDTSMVDAVHGYMRDEYAISFRRLFFPLIQVCRYAAGASWTGKVIFWLGVIGAVSLFHRRRWIEVAVLLAPIPIAYLFALMGKLPLGATRHSAHLYPMIFALAAFGAWTLAGLLAGRKGNPDQRKWNRALPIAVTALLYINASFVVFSRPMTLDEDELPYYRPRSLRIAESPTLKKDLDDAWSEIRKSASPQDLILVSYQGLLILRSRLQPGPMHYDPRSPVDFTVDGLKVRYSPRAGWGFVPASFLDAIADIEKREGISEWKKAWVINTGWERWGVKLPEQFRKLAPPIDLQTPLREESKGLVLGLHAETIARIREQFARSGSRP